MMDLDEQRGISCPHCGSDNVLPCNEYSSNSVPNGRSKSVKNRRNACKSCGIYYNPKYAQS